MSGGNANTTIAYPGPNWQMFWLSEGQGEFRNFQLDIVGFLAVLGEGSVTANAQVSALSSLFYLPRLIPAPQALLWPSRPVELPPTKATVTGVESGIVKEHVHHVANILLGGEMKKHTVRCVRVTKAPDAARRLRLTQRIFQSEKQHQKEAELGPSQTILPPVVKAKANGPLSWVTLSSFALALIMFIISIVFGDGMSLIATLLLSLLSTLIGIVNKCTLQLPQRPKGAALAPQVHVVVRYPNGSFLVVKCDENVARELYFAPEEIEYKVKSQGIYRLISLVGTLMLMGGVIALANARLQLQFAWAGAYILTNALHWIAAAVPARMHWDLSCYRVKEEGITDGPESSTFTEALWKTIVFTKNTEWIKNGDAAPRTPIWDAWLQYVQQKASDLGEHEGVLTDPNPHWLKPGEERGVIWEVPKSFNAKSEWDRLYRESQMEKATFDSKSPTLHNTNGWNGSV